ncbi:glutamate racemase [uncultured Eudoraea sp.]|uniref:glutamate racemase n=1 Tax=uncultured Eudoraea sp. TaxID=1035614 RepID=UPI00262AC6F0|nr:glutamate racemase [uncultured Eudoraea sp.]
MNAKPIGIFDSGVGGTSIWKEIHALLPYENTIYLADSKNAPYGQKTREEIIALSVKNTELLLARGCKLIVVACNTATTNAISHLRENYKVPFIGIEPAIKPAALNSGTGTVGVLATKGTLSSSLFLKTSKDHAGEITIVEKEGIGLVPLIEAGKINTTETKELLISYIKPMLEANIDHIVLGCTHYPYLIPVLRELLPPHVNIIDCGAAVAKQTMAVLNKENLQNPKKTPGNIQFYTNKDTEILTSFLKDVDEIKQITYLNF